MTVVIDTNVLVDLFARRQPFFIDAEAFMNEVSSGAVKGVCPSHCLTTIYYIVQRHGSAEVAIAAIDKLLSHVDVIGLHKSDWLKVRTIPWADVEDGAVALTAELAGASFVITRNLADFALSEVPAMLPGEFVTRFISPPA